MIDIAGRRHPKPWQMQISVCNVKVLPIISVKAEDKLELIWWKVKNIPKKLC